MLLRRRHRQNPLILSASATGIIVGLLVSVTTGLAVAMTSTNSAQADTSSSVTLTAAANDMNGGVDAPLPNLAVTVSQTQGLLSQAIEVSWTGGKTSSTPSSSTGGANFLQIAQCWGEDPLNPGHPDRTTCQYGGFGSSVGATRGGTVECPLAEVDGVRSHPFFAHVPCVKNGDRFLRQLAFNLSTDGVRLKQNESCHEHGTGQHATTEIQ